MPVHISRAVLLIGDEGPIGRIELSRKLGLGEGAVRTIIKHMSSRKFIGPAKEGFVLTQRGMTLYKSLRSKLSEVHAVNAQELALDKASAAVLVRSSARIVRRGVEQRDAALRAGGTGACTLLCRNDKLAMPMSVAGERTPASRNLFEGLQLMFGPEDGDVIVIVSAPNMGLAEHCAIAAALTLLR